MGREFWMRHLLVPLCVFFVSVVILELTPLDTLLADWIYRLEGGRWSLKDHPLFSTVLHDGARWVMVGIALAVIATAVASRWIERMRRWRRPLAYLAVVMPLSALLISALKGVTHVDCPWDLLRYGGDRPYLRLFEAHPGAYPFGKCFPSGHASGGYALVAFYFFFREAAPRWRRWGLAVGLGAGMIFGVVQQLRGAHFISHDLWTLAICWLNSLLWYWIFFRGRHRVAHGGEVLT